MNSMEMTWSLGKTVMTYELPVERPIDKDPADMTLDELIATQDRELPTMSRASWRLIGAGTWSLDRPGSTVDGEGSGSTIADQLPDDHELKTGWQTAKPFSEMNREELRAFDKWNAEHTRGTNLVPYTTVHPLTAWRIQQEKDSVRSGPLVEYRIVDQHGKLTVQIRGKQLTSEQFVTEAKKYLRMLRDAYGYIPTLEDIEADYAEAKELWEAIRRGEVGFRKVDYQENYLMSTETDPYREELFDELAHTSYEAYEEPWIDDTFVMQSGLNPDEVLDSMPRSLILHFRSHRDWLRYQADKQNNDAFWHARIGQPLELGEDTPAPPRGQRMTLNKIGDRVVSLAQSSINALSILRD